jgi:hypothetical protein
MASVRIIHRILERDTNIITALTIAAEYEQSASAEVTILMRPCAVPNDDKSIRLEIERLGHALIAVAQSPTGVTD